MNDARVYIVRIWSSSAPPAGFRAAVRAVDKDEARLFADAGQLGAYFEAELAVEAELAAGPGSGPDSSLDTNLSAENSTHPGTGRGHRGADRRAGGPTTLAASLAVTEIAPAPDPMRPRPSVATKG